MTLRDELLQIISHLPDCALEELAPAIRAQDVRYTPADWRAARQRALAFRAAMIARYGELPDAATLALERRNARLRGLLTTPPPVLSLDQDEPPELPRAAA
ncbi:MAG: hypothetical protein Kow0077_19600 [Anaerolineae bacterium]